VSSWRLLRTQEIGFDSYITKYKKYLEVKRMQQTVVLKQFKSFDNETLELFISEVSSN